MYQPLFIIHYEICWGLILLQQNLHFFNVHSILWPLFNLILKLLFFSKTRSAKLPVSWNWTRVQFSLDFFILNSALRERNWHKKPLLLLESAKLDILLFSVNVKTPLCICNQTCIPSQFQSRSSIFGRSIVLMCSVLIKKHLYLWTKKSFKSYATSPTTASTRYVWLYCKIHSQKILNAALDPESKVYA